MLLWIKQFVVWHTKILSSCLYLHQKHTHTHTHSLSLTHKTSSCQSVPLPQYSFFFLSLRHRHTYSFSLFLSGYISETNASRTTTIHNNSHLLISRFCILFLLWNFSFKCATTTITTKRRMQTRQFLWELSSQERQK